MLTALIVCLCLATNLNADHSTRSSSATSISTSTNASPVDSSNFSSQSDAAASTPSPPPLFIIDDELAKLEASCITFSEHEQLSGYQFRFRIARLFNGQLIKEADTMIGREELRAAFGFAPPGNWTKNRQPPSAEELAAAPTVEAYFELREPRSEDRSLDSEYFFEYNFPPVIAYLDKRFPTVRQIFRRKFEEILRLYAGRSIDKKTVDHMIDEFRAIRNRVNHAMSEMNDRTNECEFAARKRLND